VSDTTLVQIGFATGSAGVPWEVRLARLEALLGDLGNVVVAYSGGVDSSLLLKVATGVLGEKCLGVIGRSDSYSEDELRMALAQAAEFGTRVEVVSTGELADPNFRSNPVNRCYFCKTELYRELAVVASARGAVILDGTIADDVADWRPGRTAAAEAGVRSPLVECGFTKADVRAAAAHLGVRSAAKPASPCLASRIPYGMEITREALRQVELGERFLRSLGLSDVRLRHHGDVARIEAPISEATILLDPAVRERLIAELRGLGYRFIALDLEGFRSGSLNRGIVDSKIAGT
jgi:uncharacterized protein